MFEGVPTGSLQFLQFSHVPRSTIFLFVSDANTSSTIQAMLLSMMVARLAFPVPRPKTLHSAEQPPSP